MKNKKFGFQLITVLFTLVVNIVIWFGAADRVVNERNMLVANAYKETSNLASAFSEHTLRTVNTVDSTLRFIEHEYINRRQFIDLPKLMQDWRAYQGEIFTEIIITGDNGNILYSSQIPFQPGNLKNHPNFLHHQQDEDDSLWIGAPVQNGDRGQWLIPMSLRFDQQDGSFGGMIMGYVTPNYFLHLYSQVNLGRDGVVYLVSLDGTILAGLSGNSIQHLGGSVKSAPLFDRLMENSVGTDWSVSVIDGVKRLRSYRTVDPYGMVVLVGIAEEDVLADYNKMRMVMFSSAGLFSIFSAVFLFILSRMYREEERAKNEVQRLNADLERRVEQRTAALALANQELEAFSYSVSHDLRSPLRALDGYSEALLTDYADCMDEDGRSYLKRIRAGSQRMANQIDELLRLAHISKMDLQKNRVDLSAMAVDIIEKLREAQPEREVTFITPVSLVVEADVFLARVLLTHLLENSWKFTAPNATARIELGKMDDVGEDVFFVRDDGVGFDPQYSKKLFKTFEHLHSPGQFEGMGMGLAVAQRIVRRHGGSIWGTSAVGKGATFYFTLGSIIEVEKWSHPGG